MEELQPKPDDVLRHKLENFSQEPDPEFWDKIDSKLPKTSTYNWVALTPWAILLFLTGSFVGGYIGQSYVFKRDQSQPDLAVYKNMNDKIDELQRAIKDQQNQHNQWVRYSLEKEATSGKMLEVMKELVKNNQQKQVNQASRNFDKGYSYIYPANENYEKRILANGTSLMSPNNLLTDSVTESKIKVTVNRAESPKDSFPAFENQEKDTVYIKAKKDLLMAKKQSRWWIGAFIAPEYTYRNAWSSSETLADKGRYERPKVDMSAGLDLIYKIAPRLSIQTGLQYLNMGEQFTIDEIYKRSGYDTTKSYKLQPLSSPRTSAQYNAITMDGQSKSNATVASEYVSNNSGTIYTSVTESIHYGTSWDTLLTTTISKVNIEKPVKAKLQSSYFILSIPLMFNYTLADIKKWSFFISTGGSLNVLLGGQKVNQSITGDVGLTKLINTGIFSASLLGRVGASYQLSENVKLNITPTFRYFMNSAVNEGQSQVQPYSLGIQLGVIKKL